MTFSHQTQPFVSVVVPAYNTASTIRETLDSILAQTYRNFEILVVNDGSLDNTLSVVAAIDDDRIRIICQHNRGLAGARNSGILAASGLYIAFIDSDDLWHPRKLEKHIRHLENRPCVDVSYSVSALIDENSKPLGLFQNPKLVNISAADIFARNPVGNGSCPVIRRTALDRIAFPHPAEEDRLCYFDETFRQSEDVECWLRLALLGKAVFEGLGEPLTLYRVNSGGLSANVTKQYQSWLLMVEKLTGYRPDFVKRHLARAKAYQLLYLARRAVRMPTRLMALHKTIAAFFLYPGMILEEPRKVATTLAAATVKAGIGIRLFAAFETLILTFFSRRAIQS